MRPSLYKRSASILPNFLPPDVTASTPGYSLHIAASSSAGWVVSSRVWRQPKSVAPPPFGPSPREGKGRVFL